MSRRPLLSVVVPFYNVADYLQPCLESLQRQTLTDLEVIMVDDESPDDSLAIAEAFAKEDPRFTVVRQHNQGPGPARNNGIAHATGTYLTFVDGDDLVPWLAYEVMTDTLRRTGSSMVAANARRFNRSGGVRQSWTHAAAFGRTRLATHITEFTALIRDRMVWNKVYRRDFWDAEGFTFPAMMYEDYMVALAAHLRSVTTDVLSMHTYYWRERESGDSITQQVFRHDNMLDRVVSAEIVCGVAAGAPADVRRAVHAYLAEVDVIALAQSFEVLEPTDVDRAFELTDRLLGVLDPAVLRSRPRYDHLQIAALRARDVDRLRELAQWRSAGGMVGGVRTRPSLVPGRRTAEFPGRRPGPWPGRYYLLPVRSLTLRTSVTDVRWDGEDLIVRGTAEINHLRANPRSTVEIDLVGGVTRVSVPLRRFVTLDSHAEQSLVGFEATVPPHAWKGFDTVVWPLWFDVTVTQGAIRRRGRLGGLGEGTPSWPSGRWFDERVWITPRRHRSGRLLLTRERPAWVESAGLVDGTFEVTVAVQDRPGKASLVVRAPGRLSDIEVPASQIRHGEALTLVDFRVPPDDLVHHLPPDDPYLLESSWPVQFVTDLGTQTLIWPGRTPVLAQQAADGTVIRIRRTLGGYVEVFQTPQRVSLTKIEFGTGPGSSEPSLLLEGLWWPDSEPAAVEWRAFHPNSDDFDAVEVPLQLAADGTWSGGIEVSRLAAVRTERLEPGAADRDWVLFVVRTDEVADAVQLEAQALVELPIRYDLQPPVLGHHEVSVIARRNTVHVEVR
ncbi:glycosyltransferase family 2 protein [Microlunatus sp. Y2014]|uniref:glycosyltransferase family 2 protein n=1 Tax=Microlunatus sp. Y2014 TaxID=3418488 RepID=UPI003DA767AF